MRMRPKSPWPSSTAEEEDLGTQVWSFLVELCRRPAIHGRLLNTLSLLEHIGSRKILLSQTGPSLKEDILRHFAEEACHAHFFRRAAEREAARPLDYRDEDLLAPASARVYFGRLDARISRELGVDLPLAYPYVTLAVEFRAGWLYGLYEKVLRSSSSALTLRTVLAEEAAHLQERKDALRQADPLYELRRTVFTRIEERLFRKLLAALRRAASPHPSNVDLSQVNSKMSSSQYDAASECELMPAGSLSSRTCPAGPARTWRCEPRTASHRELKSVTKYVCGSIYFRAIGFRQRVDIGGRQTCSGMAEEV